MATPLQDIIDIIYTFKSTEFTFANESIPINYAKVGVTQTGIALGIKMKTYYLMEPVLDSEGNSTIQKVYYAKLVNLNEDGTDDLSDEQTYICGLHAFRNYAIQIHDTLAQKAVNFKTINFAVSGLTERAKEMQRIVWWCDTEVKRVLGLMDDPIGKSNEMKGDAYSGK